LTEPQPQCHQAMNTFYGSNKIENLGADLSLRLQEGELSPNEVF